MFRHEERIIPDLAYREAYPTYAQFIGRYAFAGRFLGPRAVVLDLGCGCGYGAAHLAEAPDRLVLGVDQSVEGVGYARTHYRARGLGFARANATVLPIKSGSLDAVVAMEMIEHVEDAKAVLSEIRRALKRSGVFVVSTPNRQVTGMKEKPDNPFHTREYTPEEFMVLLQRDFSCVSLYGQDLSPASRAYQDNLERIWHDLYVLRRLGGELRAALDGLRCRVEIDERFTGLALLRKLKDAWLGWAGAAPKPLDGEPVDIDRDFRQFQAIVSGTAAWEISTYQVDTAPVLVALCRP